MKKKKKIPAFFMKKKVLVALTIAGFLSLLFVGGYAKYQSLLTPEVVVNATEFEQNKNEVADFTAQNIVPINEAEMAIAGWRNEKEPSQNIQVGTIAIPDVNLYLNIYKGIGGDHLWLGACTFREKQEMGKENYVLLAHNTVNPRLLFGPLKHTTVGMSVYLTDGSTVFTYEIKNHDIIDQSETEYANSEPGDEKLTLITCYGGEGTTKRRIVVADLKQKEDIAKSSIF